MIVKVLKKEVLKMARRKRRGSRLPKPGQTMALNGQPGINVRAKRSGAAVRYYIDGPAESVKNLAAQHGIEA